MCAIKCNGFSSRSIFTHSRDMHSSLGLYLDVRDLNIFIVVETHGVRGRNLKIYASPSGKNIASIIDHPYSSKVGMHDFTHFKLTQEFCRYAKDVIQHNLFYDEYMTYLLK